MLNIKHNNFAIEEKDISHVHTVRPKLKSAKDDIKPSLYYGCSLLHFKKDCYFKNKKCFSCVFLGCKSMYYQRKNKNWEKTVFSKIKIFSVQWKIKMFNDRVKVIVSRKEIEKWKYVNVKINGVNI